MRTRRHASTPKRTRKKRAKRKNAGPITAEEIADARARGRVHKCYVGLNSARNRMRAVRGDAYIGETHDLIRRRRQHRGEIRGGANITSLFSGQFVFLLALRRLACVRDAKQFEWRLTKWYRFPPRLKKKPESIAAHAAIDACRIAGCAQGDPTTRKIVRALLHTLLIDRWTKNSLRRDDPLRAREPVLEVHWMVPSALHLGYDVGALVTRHPVRHIFGATAESVDGVDASAATAAAAAAEGAENEEGAPRADSPDSDSDSESVDAEDADDANDDSSLRAESKEVKLQKKRRTPPSSRIAQLGPKKVVALEESKKKRRRISRKSMDAGGGGGGGGGGVLEAAKTTKKRAANQSVASSSSSSSDAATAAVSEVAHGLSSKRRRKETPVQTSEPEIATPKKKKKTPRRVPRETFSALFQKRLSRVPPGQRAEENVGVLSQSNFEPEGNPSNPIEILDSD